jgi:hypothetical protein
MDPMQGKGWESPDVPFRRPGERQDGPLHILRERPGNVTVPASLTVSKIFSQQIDTW